MEATDITKILEVIILVIIAPLMPIVVFKLRQWVDSKLTADQQRQIDWAVTSAVLAAEQLGLSGAEARNWAVMTATNILRQYGITADLDYLEALIEATVMDEFNKSKLVANS